MLHACVTRVWIPGMRIKAEGAGFSAHNTCIRQADTGDPGGKLASAENSGFSKRSCFSK